MTTSSENTPFDDLMRSALGDDLTWARMLLDESLTSPVQAWLRSTMQGIDHQLVVNADTLEQDLLSLHGDAVRARKAEFYQWRKRAQHLKFLCQRRMADLTERRKREKVRAEAYKNLLLDLADAVLDHQDAAITDAQLHAELDALRLPGTPARSLREYLEEIEEPETNEVRSA